MRIRILIPALVLAACGDAGGAVVEGTFAPGLSADGVWVVESERRERADSSGFQVADLTPGPVGLRLMQGADTVARLDVSGLPAGARLRLLDLRVDGDSRYAFPRAVELDGARMVTVNGVRMAPADRIPRVVDVRAAVLAWSSDVGALLVRPADAALPDLRVVVGMATEVVGTDGGGADPVTLRPGDSVRVEGRRDGEYVVASRITVPTRIGGAAAVIESNANVAETSDVGEDEGGMAPVRSSGATGSDGDGSPAATPVRVQPSAPAARSAAVRADDRGRGQGRGHGQEKGRGKGRGDRHRG